MDPAQRNTFPTEGSIKFNYSPTYSVPVTRCKLQGGILSVSTATLVSPPYYQLYVVKMAVLIFWLILYSRVKPYPQPLTKLVLCSRLVLNCGPQGLVLCGNRKWGTGLEPEPELPQWKRGTEAQSATSAASSRSNCLSLPQARCVVCSVCKCEWETSNF